MSLSIIAVFIPIDLILTKLVGFTEGTVIVIC